MDGQVKVDSAWIDAKGRERHITAVQGANVWWRYAGTTKTYGPKFAPHWAYENRLKGTPEADARLAKLLPDPRDAVIEAARESCQILRAFAWDTPPRKAGEKLHTALTALDAAKAASPK